MTGATIEPSRWIVIPEGIEETKFSDPESFYLSIRLHRRGTDPDKFVVSCGTDQQGFTRNGVLVFLRHDVNAKHAFHDSFEKASALARALADGTLETEYYRPWRKAQEQRWPGERP